MKELPYFKFYPAEWIKGEITLCSMEAQGLFINICTYYWMKGCNMSLTGVQHRFNTCSEMLKELIDLEIITVLDDKICIDFLDDQFSEFEKLSKKKSRAGKASAKARKINTRSTPVQQVFQSFFVLHADSLPMQCRPCFSSSATQWPSRDRQQPVRCEAGRPPR